MCFIYKTQTTFVFVPGVHSFHIVAKHYLKTVEISLQSVTMADTMQQKWVPQYDDSTTDSSDDPGDREEKLSQLQTPNGLEALATTSQISYGPSTVNSNHTDLHGVSIRKIYKANISTNNAAPKGPSSAYNINKQNQPQKQKSTRREPPQSANNRKHNNNNNYNKSLGDNDPKNAHHTYNNMNNQNINQFEEKSYYVNKNENDNASPRNNTQATNNNNNNAYHLPVRGVNKQQSQQNNQYGNDNGQGPSNIYHNYKCNNNNINVTYTHNAAPRQQIQQPYRNDYIDYNDYNNSNNNNNFQGNNNYHSSHVNNNVPNVSSSEKQKAVDAALATMQITAPEYLPESIYQQLANEAVDFSCNYFSTFINATLKTNNEFELAKADYKDKLQSENNQCQDNQRHIRQRETELEVEIQRLILETKQRKKELVQVREAAESEILKEKKIKKEIESMDKMETIIAICGIQPSNYQKHSMFHRTLQQDNVYNTNSTQGKQQILSRYYKFTSRDIWSWTYAKKYDVPGRVLVAKMGINEADSNGHSGYGICEITAGVNVGYKSHFSGADCREPYQHKPCSHSNKYVKLFDPLRVLNHSKVILNMEWHDNTPQGFSRWKSVDIKKPNGEPFALKWRCSHSDCRNTSYAVR